MTLTWLADVLRADGLVVVEHPDWRDHDRAGEWSPRYGVVHATAAPATQDDATQIRVVRDGRADLPGPIANAVVDRRGRWHVVSGGRCNSTLVGTAGPYAGWGNTYALSVEGCNNNLTEPWPAAQYDAYVRGWAAWCRRLGWPADRLVGHKEHTPNRKTDPTFNMDTFRADVARRIKGDATMTDTASTQVAEIRRQLLDPAEGFGTPRKPTLDGLRDAAYAVVVGNTTTTWLGRTLQATSDAAVAASRDAGEAVDQLVAVAGRVEQLAQAVDRLAAPAAIDYGQLADAIVRRVLTGAPPAAATPE